MISRLRDFIKRFGHRILLVGLLCLSAFCQVQAQTSSPGSGGKEKVRIDLLYADEAVADQGRRPDTQILNGNVQLRHDSMYMYCDSAFIYEKTNSVEAFGNVRMEQGDTLFIYGDYLFYDGEAQLAQLRERVSLINNQARLDADSLNYDRILNLGYFFNGGILQDESNVLTSEWGEYSPVTKQASFNIDVVLENDRMILHSDTLKYNTQTKVAVIRGPSTIDNEDNHIYSEHGIYNTATEQAQLLDRSVIRTETREVVGDSLFYDRISGIGEGFGNVMMNDTVNKNAMYGNYCFYDDLEGSAFATGHAYAVDYSQGDSLFMGADTLRLVTFNINTDSVYRHMRAYRNVRVYRQDIQAVCDSMEFSSLDSCLTMYSQPVIWSGSDQLLGERIKVFMNDSTIDWAHVMNQALAVEAFDSQHYNQVSGKEMMAYFHDGELRQVDVNGNVLVVYYPVDEKDSTIIGMDYTEGSFMRLELREQKMQRGSFRGEASGVLYPLDQVPSGKDFLPSYVWLADIRPKDRYDIFDVKVREDDKLLKPQERPQTSTPRQMNIRRNR